MCVKIATSPISRGVLIKDTPNAPLYLGSPASSGTSHPEQLDD